MARRRVFSSLPARLILLHVLIALPMLGILLYNASIAHQREKEDAAEQLLRTVRLVSFEQERQIEETRVLLTLLARLPAVRLHDSSECSTFFADLLKHYPAYTDFVAATAGGEIFCRGIQPWQVSSVTDRLWFKRMLETRDFVMGEYKIGRMSKKAVISFGYPILGNAGQVLGAVATGVDLFRLSKTMANTNLPSGSIVTIFDATGTILARVPDHEQWVGKSGADTSLFRIMTTRKGEGTAEIRGRDGGIHLAGFTNLHGWPQGQDGYVSMVVPGAALFDKSLARNLVGLGLLAVLGFAGVWLQIRRSILRPVGTLMRATTRLAAGDLSQRVAAGSLVEIDALATAFNTLADRLVAQTRERTLLNEMGDLLQVCNTVKDACPVVARLAAQLFPASSGAVFLFHPSRDLVECAAA